MPVAPFRLQGDDALIPWTSRRPRMRSSSRDVHREPGGRCPGADQDRLSKRNRSLVTVAVRAGRLAAEAYEAYVLSLSELE